MLMRKTSSVVFLNGVRVLTDLRTRLSALLDLGKESSAKPNAVGAASFVVIMPR